VATALVLLGLALLVPDASAQQGRPVAILMPGAGGIHPEDFLVRNRERIGAAGIETRITTSPGEAASLARAERQKGRKVVLVGMSRGAGDVAKALAAGAPANGAVLVSGGMRQVIDALGSSARLPATLIVHHRNDGCQKTPPGGVTRFQKWAGGNVRVVWIDGGGPPHPNPCGPHGAHGFYHRDGQPVSAIVDFIRSR
jgi:dienelactone hydrolase